MKTYEMVFEEKQPTCGGKSPVNTSISMVTIEDPLEYVKAKENETTSRFLEQLENLPNLSHEELEQLSKKIKEIKN